MRAANGLGGEQAYSSSDRLSEQRKNNINGQIDCRGRTAGMDGSFFKASRPRGTPDRPEDYKDSERHRQAGALAAGVEGGGVLQITAAKTNWRLEEILPLYNSFPVDLLLIEGYKRAGYPKVVLIKEPHELELLEQLVNVQAVISWKPIALQQPTCPVFLLSEEERYINWFVSYMRNSLV